MMTMTLPVLFAIFIWWFSTGLILLLDGLPRTTFRWSLVISSALAVVAFVALVQTSGKTDVASAYCAFTCALLVWGWHELSFLTGWITGPRKEGSPAGASEDQRFLHAVQAILWHELWIIGVGLAMVAATWNAPNQIGTWTFLVLWVMRTSSKLNLFLGVRNFSEEFLPPHLMYLKSYFRRRPMNLLFPFSVTAATVVAWLMVMAAMEAPPALSAGLILVTTMLALRILEHWLLVLPIPATALWRWAMRHADGSDAKGSAAPATPAKETLLHAR